MIGRIARGLGLALLCVAYAVAQPSLPPNLSAYALLASPALTGVPTAPTPSLTSNDTTIPNTAWFWGQPAIQQIPDSTTAGGNARGTNAVDWQSTRSAATQVASGANATIVGGMNSTATGIASIAGGDGSTASGSRAVALGDTNVADGSFSVALGRYASARSLSRIVYASGRIASTGDVQATLGMVGRRQTTDATSTRLTTDGAAAASSNGLTLPNNATIAVRYLVVARQTGGSAGTVGDSAMWDFTALYRRGASAAATVMVDGGGGTPQRRDTGAATWTAAAGADTTNGQAAVSVVGEANKSLTWAVYIVSVEVAG